MRNTVKKAFVILMTFGLAASVFATSISGFGVGMAMNKATLEEGNYSGTAKTSAMVLNLESETLLIGFVGIGTNTAIGKVTDQTLNVNGKLSTSSMKDVIPFPLYSDTTFGAAVRLPVFPLVHLTGLAGVHLNTSMCETALCTAGLGMKAGVEVAVGPIGVRAGAQYFNDWINVMGYLLDSEKNVSIKQTGFTPYLSIILKR